MNDLIKFFKAKNSFFFPTWMYNMETCKKADIFQIFFLT